MKKDDKNIGANAKLTPSKKYDYLNQNSWSALSPQCRNGKEQSPIDLTESGSSKSETLGLKGYGFENMNKAHLERNSNTVSLDLDGGEL